MWFVTADVQGNLLFAMARIQKSKVIEDFVRFMIFLQNRASYFAIREIICF